MLASAATVAAEADVAAAVAAADDLLLRHGQPKQEK